MEDEVIIPSVLRKSRLILATGVGDYNRVMDIAHKVHDDSIGVAQHE